MTEVREFAGSPAEMRQVVDTLTAAGQLRAVEPPRWDAAAGKLRMRVWLHHPGTQSVQPVVRRQVEPVVVHRGLWGWVDRVRVGPAAAVAGGVGVVGLGVWLAARGVSAAGRWAAGNSALLAGVGLLVAVVGILWVTRERVPRTRAGRGCAGVAHHCPRCPDH